MEDIILEVGNVYTKVRNSNYQIDNIIDKVTSYTDPNYKYKIKYMLENTNNYNKIKHLKKKINNYEIEGKIHLYNRKTKQFPTGLLSTVKMILKLEGYKYSIIELYKYSEEEVDISFSSHLKLYSHQEKAFNSLKKHNFRGIIDGATGMGKTVLGIYILSYLKTPTVIIVPTTVIQKQWIEKIKELIDIEDKTKKFGSGIMFYDKNGKESIFVTTISLINSIMSNKAKSDKILKRNIFLRRFFYKKVGLIIFDEVHLAGSKSGIVSLSSIPSYYRIGLTGTFGKRDDEKDFEYTALIGNRVCTISIDELIENKKAVPLNIYFYETSMPYIHYNCNYEEVYLDAIVNNIDRNEEILHQTDRLLEEGRKVLILVDRIVHAQLLSKMSGITYTTGDDKLKDEKIEEFKNSKEPTVLICTTKLVGIGFDMPPLSALVLACGGKASIKIIQALGRTIRISNNKKNAVIIDFADDVKYLREHSIKRTQIYLNNSSYKVNLGKTFLKTYFSRILNY